MPPSPTAPSRPEELRHHTQEELITAGMMAPPPSSNGAAAMPGAGGAWAGDAFPGLAGMGEVAGPLAHLQHLQQQGASPFQQPAQLASMAQAHTFTTAAAADAAAMRMAGGGGGGGLSAGVAAPRGLGQQGPGGDDQGLLLAAMASAGAAPPHYSTLQGMMAAGYGTPFGSGGGGVQHAERYGVPHPEVDQRGAHYSMPSSAPLSPQQRVQQYMAMAAGFAHGPSSMGMPAVAAATAALLQLSGASTAAMQASGNLTAGIPAQHLLTDGANPNGTFFAAAPPGLPSAATSTHQHHHHGQGASGRRRSAGARRPQHAAQAHAPEDHTLAPHSSGALSPRPTFVGTLSLSSPLPIAALPVAGLTVAHTDSHGTTDSNSFASISAPLQGLMVGGGAADAGGPAHHGANITLAAMQQQASAGNPLMISPASSLQHAGDTRDLAALTAQLQGLATPAAAGDGAAPASAAAAAASQRMAMMQVLASALQHELTSLSGAGAASAQAAAGRDDA